jgi:hypothetical protein
VRPGGSGLVNPATLGTLLESGALLSIGSINDWASEIEAYTFPVKKLLAEER